ncbi:MAG: DNA alkylation repair protein [Candidatus Pacebacteria bacterium]|nr:DNA alkylation repair protein [Candidatus Paceibacterota bacterium]
MNSKDMNKINKKEIKKDLLKIIRNHILKIATTERADTNKYFFKTEKGEYGEGDKFLGITVPQTRNISKAFCDLDLKETGNLLKSEFHEERLLALYILINKFQEASISNSKSSKNNENKIREEIFNLYFKNIKYINNWDLVDFSAPKIVGNYIKEKHSLKSKNCSGVKFLISLVKDENKFAKNKKEKLWEKRIAIVSTYSFMQKPFKNEYSPEIIFEIAIEILNEKDELNNHDLIQKAVGWMLREYGKRINEKKLKEFLNKNFEKIKTKRTLLRYAIERFPEKERKGYLNRR